MSKNAIAARGRILVLADDLTGALEAGAKFAGQGIPARVIVANQDWIPAAPRGIPVLVLDTETRHVSPDEAERKIYALTRAAIADGFGLMYKKTDSTLRGNIGSELRGLLEGCPGRSLLYVPAYPTMGRIVKQGVLYVGGQPVSATDFACDDLNPVTESSVVKLLTPHVPVSSVSVDQGKVCNANSGSVYVCDAESDDEVERWAQFFWGSADFNLAAGPAAFLHCLAKRTQLPRSQPAQLPRANRVLIVSGSRNSKSLGQIQYAKRDGFPIISLSSQLGQMGDKGWWILHHDSETTELPDQLAAQVASILDKAELDALVVFGGDTAYAVLRVLGESEVSPIGEVVEGVPVSRVWFQRNSGSPGGFERDILLITKAGGFGPRNVLQQIRDALA